MKKYLIYFSLITGQIFAQTPKIEAIVGASEPDAPAIRAVIKKTHDFANYKGAVEGEYLGDNAFGYGVFGKSLLGIGVNGVSQSGFGVRGASDFGDGVFGFANSGNAGSFNVNGTGNAGYFDVSNGSGNAIITGRGKVGIGIDTPNDLLDVNGRMRLRHNVNSSGVWMSNSTNSLNSADGAFYGMKTDAQTGIYIGNNWQFWVTSLGDGQLTGKLGLGVAPLEKLHVNGNVRISGIASLGYNNVIVNSEGTLMGLQTVAFLTKNNTSLIPISNATTLTFPFSTEEYDLGGFFDNSTYEFSAPTNGIYHFDSFVTFGIVNTTYLTSIFNLSLMVDNSAISINTTTCLVGGYKTLTLSQDLKLNAGQKVKLSVYQDSGNEIKMIGTSHSKFSGRLVMKI